ncbi:hypothetical protein R1flu_001625 [Riccia fluitans]|uniref:Uncharacterized protein n=1 Tax=Riccia fluitans TaxID=41844 RepID=A0ABD1Y3T2_9MARC
MSEEPKPDESESAKLEPEEGLVNSGVGAPAAEPKRSDEVQEVKQNVVSETSEGQKLNRRSYKGNAVAEPKKDIRPEESKRKSTSEKGEGEPQQITSSAAPGAEPKDDVGIEKAKRKHSSDKKVEQPRRRSSKEAAKRKSTLKPFKGGAGGNYLDYDEDEEKEEEPKTIYPIDEKVQRCLRTAWTLLVKKNQKKKTEISEADVPTVMRSIGINPTEAQIETLIAYAKTQDLPTCSKNFLTYENFEQRVAETLHLQPELWIRKTKDQIMAALHTVCEYKDDIEGEKFKIFSRRMPYPNHHQIPQYGSSKVKTLLVMVREILISRIVFVSEIVVTAPNSCLVPESVGI